MGLFGDIVNLFGGIGQMVQQKRSIELAEKMNEQGQYWRNVGFQGLQGSIQRRQQAYNDIWNMVYGGVGGQGFGFNKPKTNTVMDRYDYDEDGNLIRKNSVGPNDGYDQLPHETNETTTTPRSRSGSSNPAATADKKDPWTITDRRGRSITGR